MQSKQKEQLWPLAGEREVEPPGAGLAKWLFLFINRVKIRPLDTNQAASRDVTLAERRAWKYGMAALQRERKRVQTPAEQREAEREERKQVSSAGGICIQGGELFP